MSYRPRFHAAFVVFFAVSSTACSLEVDLRGSSFSCSVSDDRCPAGLSCVDNRCVPPGEGVVDAGDAPEQRDADPVDPVIDAGTEPQDVDAGAVDGDPMFVHTVEGPDDMPAHIRMALTAVNLSVPVDRGRLCLGTWQGIYLWEHRRRAHRRTVTVHVIGEPA